MALQGATRARLPTWCTCLYAGVAVAREVCPTGILVRGAEARHANRSGGTERKAATAPARNLAGAA